MSNTFRIVSVILVLVLIYFTRTYYQPHSRFSTANAGAFLDEWHRDAALGRLEPFFAKMAPNAFYLGTQFDERWDKQSFYTFCKPYFDRGNAWDFKPIARNYDYSADSAMIWFDETLETWMGLCRGTGVLDASGDSLLIKQYSLTVCVPNNKVKAYVDLIKENPENAFLRDSIP